MNSEPIEQASAWLYRVARNRIIDKYRRQQPDSPEDLFSDTDESEFNFREMLLAENITPETEYLRNAFWEQLFSAISDNNEQPKSPDNVTA